MYIHRVAIDANQANARGNLAAMSELEQLHDACLIEIVCTSTMETDLRSAPQRQKVSKYDRIYAGGQFYLTESRIPDAAVGPVLRKSRFMEIYQSVFGDVARADLNSLRDVLHIDQCWQNMVDYFVTDDRKLYNCANMDFTICDADRCLDNLRTYFRTTAGTSDIGKLSEKAAELGPILLGSNSSGSFECRDRSGSHSLLRVDADRHGMSVFCTIRDEQGKELVNILPEKEYEFSLGDAAVSLLAGPSPLKLGTNHCKSFAVTLGDRALLAGRIVRPGRLVIFEALLRQSDGTDAFVIHRSLFGLYGTSFALRSD